MSKKCPACGSKKIIMGSCEFAYCIGCELFDMVEKFPEQSVFDRITASPEVLAEKLVYQAAIKTSKLVYDHRGRGVGVRYDIEEVWKSTITEDTYTSKSEAHAATVAKLKEVVG